MLSMVKTFFKNYQITCNNICKIATVQRDVYTTSCFLDYNYFKYCYKISAIDLSKQQELDADSNSIQQIDFNGNLENNATIFFIIKKPKVTILDFWQVTVKLLQLYFDLK